MIFVSNSIINLRRAFLPTYLFGEKFQHLFTLEFAYKL